MKKQTLKNFRNVALLGGLALVVGGFFYDVLLAGIPYQDPTPAMQKRYDFHSGVASCIEMAGAVMMICGCVIWIAGGLSKDIREPKPDREGSA